MIRNLTKMTEMHEVSSKGFD